MSGPTGEAFFVLNVLIVDDDRLSRHYVAELVRKFGHRPLLAESGEAALALLAGAPAIDLVLLDIVMPDLDGYQVARRMRRMAGCRWLPIAFLSGQDERDSRQVWTEIGDDFLTKPVDGQLLRARLRALAATLRLEREARQAAEEMAGEQRLARHLMERIGFQQRGSDFDCIEVHRSAVSISSGDCVAIEGSDERFQILVADAMGHGLAAAVTLQPAISIFRAMAQKGFEPPMIAREINQKLHAVLPRERFVSACLVEVDCRRRLVTACNCGLPAGLVVAAEGGVLADFPSLLPPLGVVDDGRFKARAATWRWPAGQRLVLCTDGLSETFGSRRDAWRSAVERLFSAPDRERAGQNLWQQGRASSFADDASLVLVELRASSAAPVEAPPLATGGGALLARLSLLPGQLRNNLGADAVLAALGKLGLADIEADARVPVVLSELLANAVDHGLLGLDSSLKARGAEGFCEYFRMREERLAALAAGHIDIEIRALGGGRAIEIEVGDSGAGFDFRAESLAEETNAVFSAGGRGLKLLRALCSRVEHFDGGRRTVATLELGISENERQEGEFAHE